MALRGWGWRLAFLGVRGGGGCAVVLQSVFKHDAMMPCDCLKQRSKMGMGAAGAALRVTLEVP